jgi:hypothetical protein
MMEMRWLVWDDEEYPKIPPHEVQFGRKYEKVIVTKRKLQYRQKIDVTVRAAAAGMWDNESIMQTANMQWSEWQDVPEVVGENTTCQ